MRTGVIHALVLLALSVCADSPAELGRDWVQATAAAPWVPRAYHTSVVYNGETWVIGGQLYFRAGGDVWYSSNGTKWTMVTDWARFATREGHTSVVHNNKMWVLGGAGEGAVWSSSDGANWTSTPIPVLWAAREYHSSVVFDNKMWILGGRSWTTYFNDV